MSNVEKCGDLKALQRESSSRSKDKLLVIGSYRAAASCPPLRSRCRGCERASLRNVGTVEVGQRAKEAMDECVADMEEALQCDMHAFQLATHIACMNARACDDQALHAVLRQKGLPSPHFDGMTQQAQWHEMSMRWEYDRIAITMQPGL